MKLIINFAPNKLDELYAARVAIQSYLDACEYVQQDDTAQEHCPISYEPMYITMPLTLELKYLRQEHPNFIWSHTDQEVITADKVPVPEKFVSWTHAARVDWLTKTVTDTRTIMQEYRNDFPYYEWTSVSVNYIFANGIEIPTDFSSWSSHDKRHWLKDNVS